MKTNIRRSSPTHQAEEMMDTGLAHPGHGLQNAPLIVPAGCLREEFVSFAHSTKTRQQAHWDFGPISLAGAQFEIPTGRHPVKTSRDASPSPRPERKNAVSVNAPAQRLAERQPSDVLWSQALALHSQQV